MPYQNEITQNMNTSEHEIVHRHKITDNGHISAWIPAILKTACTAALKIKSRVKKKTQSDGNSMETQWKVPQRSHDIFVI